ncbi:MAG TPA: ribonuclease E/G, partial [Deferrisomatales bacterium]|nr:ribonuclease E/G [Deferrisomatales bacterium]
MSKSMLVNVVNDEESRIAIVADGRLEELSIETAQQEQIEGNIYKARIVKIIASLDAVFVDYGRERNGFLAAPDIHPQYFRGDKRDVDSLRKGQDLLVQVKKGEIGNKGAALTTYVSLPGRHFVLMPLVSKRGVSRRIDDEATRKQLREILDGSG